MILMVLSMVEAAGVGSSIGIDSKQLIDSKGKLETHRTQKTRLSHTYHTRGLSRERCESARPPEKKSLMAARVVKKNIGSLCRIRLVQELAKPTPSVPRRWWRTLFKVCLVVFVSLFLVAASGIALLIWGCSPPSLGTLERRFPHQRADLETIISMSDHDVQLLRIDPNWLLTTERQCLTYCRESGITPERWDEYRRLFSRNDITQGIERDPATRDAFILVKSFGILENGTTSGYLYCGPGPAHVYPPCSSSQPTGDHPYSPGDEAYSYRKLTDHWYAYTRGPG